MHIKTNPKDKMSFNQLYNDYQTRFLNFANTYVRDWDVAEDITTEALIYYWENRNTLSEVSNIPAYILTIREEHSENIRKYIEWELNARIVSLDACEPYELLVKEMQELIQQTLDKLPERTRKIFILSRYENKSYKEIAALMNMTTKGVDFHICKALKALQINLKDYFPLFLYFLMKFH